MRMSGNLCIIDVLSGVSTWLNVLGRQCVNTKCMSNF